MGAAFARLPKDRGRARNFPSYLTAARACPTSFMSGTTGIS